MHIASPVYGSHTGPGTGKPNEQEERQGNETSDRNVFYDCVSAPSRAGCWARCLVGPRGLVRRGSLVLRLALALSRSSAAEGRAAIGTEFRRIRIG